MQAGLQTLQGYSRLEISPNWHLRGREPKNPRLPPGQPRPVGYAAHTTLSCPASHPVVAGLRDHRVDNFFEASVAQAFAVCLFLPQGSLCPSFSLSSYSLNISQLLGVGGSETREEMRCALGLASLENSSDLEKGEVSLPVFLFF